MFIKSFLQPQPAHKLYPFSRGWRILLYGTKQLFQRSHYVVNWWINEIEELRVLASSLHWFKRFWLYLWMGSIALYGCVFCLAMATIEILSIVVFGAYLSVAATIYVLLIIVFTIGPAINSKINARFYCCPSCHRSMSIPVYRCPTCGKEHTRLMPNLYGIRKHRCRGCQKDLPAMSIFGRDTIIRRYCPYCKRPLNKGIGKGSNIHIPLVGGPSVGKTTYMTMSIDAFNHSFFTTYGTAVSFPDPTHKQIFQRSLRLLASGQTLPKTPDLVPYAYNLLFKIPRFWTLSKLLYIYDAQGEIFASLEGLSHQEYYKYTKGIIFMIDPFALPRYCEEHSEEIKRIHNSLRPATLDVEHTYGRLIETLDTIEGSRNRLPMPIAIVVNKTDALNLEDEIGESATQILKLQDPTLSTEDAISALVREFLLNYDLANFVHDIEARFHHVKYFSCSALGRLPSPSDTSSFTAVRVLEPLVWLLTTTRIIRWK